MIKPSEFQILLLAVAFAPLIIWALHGVDWPGRRWLAVALIALSVSYVTTVAEGFALPGIFNLVEHVGYAAGGVCFAMACRGFLQGIGLPGGEGP